MLKGAPEVQLIDVPDEVNPGELEGASSGDRVFRELLVLQLRQVLLQPALVVVGQAHDELFL